MKLFISSLLSLAFIISSDAQTELKKITASSRISDVILYRDQALTIRQVTAPETAGEFALVVENLPESVVPGSLFASSKDLKIRSVSYETEPLPENLPLDKIAQLEAKLKDLNVAKGIVASKQAVLRTRESYLDRIEKQYISKLGPMSIPINDKGMAVSGFNFDSIAKMTEFAFQQRDAILKENLALEDEARKIDDSIRDTQSQLKLLGWRERPDRPQRQQAMSLPDPKKFLRKAVIYAAKSNPGKATASLSYLVSNAGWNPAYNMRSLSSGTKLNVEYLAHVRQNSGEDWNGVKLTLSTATPNMDAEIPLLVPMWINLTPTTAKKGASLSLLESGSNPLADTVVAQQCALNKTNSAVIINRDASPANCEFAQRAPQAVDINMTLNTNAWKRQNIEFNAEKKILKRWEEDVRKLEEQMAVEYKIPEAVTLASRNDAQMVQILSATLDSTLRYEAIPLLASYVSRSIEAKNTIDQPLLEGRYSAFIDGQYVGAGKVPVTATGQTLFLGFGIDPQLRCRRELVDKIADKSWGSRTETYKYCLILDNYKSTPVNVQLYDRIPVTKDKGLEITLLEGKDKLSNDPDYREFDLPKGLLRWDVTVPASSSGSKAFKLDYSFDMKFDSDMQIAGQGEQIREKLCEDIQMYKIRRTKK